MISLSENPGARIKEISRVKKMMGKENKANIISPILIIDEAIRKAWSFPFLERIVVKTGIKAVAKAPITRSSKIILGILKAA